MKLGVFISIILFSILVGGCTTNNIIDTSNNTTTQIKSMYNLTSEQIKEKIIRDGSICYFAYGANMDSTLIQLRGVNYSLRDPGTLYNWSLTFNKIGNIKKGTGFANIIPKENSKVEGVVYYTNMASITDLDVHEGYPTQYNRTELIININGTIKKCQVYIANPEATSFALKPSRIYLNSMLQGKDYLSREYYTMLLNVTTID